MSEITGTYKSNTNAHRYGPITAKAEKLITGGLIGYVWVIDENSLPAELIDSDNAKSEASGGGTIRFSLDADGVNQMYIDVQDFTPASGGAGGGATAEIWLTIDEFTGGEDKDVYVWWITGGSQTQSDTAAQVYDSTISFISHDGGLTDSSSTGSTQTDTGTANTTTAQIGKSAREHGTGDSMETQIDQNNAPNSFTWMAWGRKTGSARYILAQWESNKGLLIQDDGSGNLSIFRDLTEVTGGTISSVWTSNTWVHVAVTFTTLSGWKVYVDGQDSGTDASTTAPDFATPTEGIYIGNRTGGSREWIGQIDEPWIVDTNLTAGQVETIYNNQSDPSTFWDTTNAVTTDYPFSHWDFEYQGRDRLWTGLIFKEGGASQSVRLCTGEDIIVTWGRQTDDFDSRVHAAELKLEIVDEDLVVFDELVDAATEETNYTLNLTDDTGTYELNMKLRLDETETNLVSNLDTHITELYGYCGLADLKTKDAVTSTATSYTMNNLFGIILCSNTISQDIEYINYHYPSNISTTGVLFDLMRLNRLDLIFIEDGRKVHTMYNQLKGLLEGFGLTAFNGMDGKWHVKHHYMLGATLNSQRGLMWYNVTANFLTTLPTLTGNDYSLLDAHVSRTARRRVVRPVQSVQANRGNNSNKFITVDLVRFGDAEEGWVSGTEHHSWIMNGCSRESTITDTGTYSFKIPTGEILTQKLPRFSAGQSIDFEIALRYALVKDSDPAGGSGTLHAYLKHVINPGAFGVAESVNAYGQPDGWDYSFPSAYSFSTQSVGASSTPIWTTVVTAARGPLPPTDDGFLQLDLFVNAALSYSAYVDSVEVRVKSGDEAKGNFIGVNAQYELGGFPGVPPFVTVVISQKGDTVDQEIQWWNGILGLDPDGDGARNTLHEMMQCLTTPNGSWVQMADFNSELSGFSTLDYPDLFQLTSDIRISRQSGVIQEIEGEIDEIVPPDYSITYNNKKHVQVYTSISLRDEITSFIAREERIITENTPAIYFGMRDAGGDLEGSGLYSISQDLDQSTITRVVATGTENYPIHLEVINSERKLLYVKATERNTIYEVSMDDFSTETVFATTPSATGRYIWDFSINESGSEVYVAEGKVNGNTGSVRVFNYSGSLVRTIAPASNFPDTLGVCYIKADNEILIINGSFWQISRYDADTGTETASVWRWGGFDPSRLQYNPDTDEVAFIEALDVAAQKIANSNSQFNTQTDIITSAGIMEDIFYCGTEQLLYVANGQGGATIEKLERMTWSGNSKEVIIDTGTTEVHCVRVYEPNGGISA